jgi:hypothetical protein
MYISERIPKYPFNKHSLYHSYNSPLLLEGNFYPPLLKGDKELIIIERR